MENNQPATSPQPTTPPPAESQPIQAPSPAVPKKLPVLFLFVGLVLIILLGGGGYYLFASNPKPSKKIVAQVSPTITQPTPTTDQTASWKTYSDTTYNFSIKYPDRTSPVFPNQSIEEAPYLDLPISYIDDYTSFSVFVDLGPAVLPPELKEEKVYTYDNGKSKSISHPSTDIEISGMKGRWFVTNIDGAYNPPTVQEYVAVVKNNHLFSLRMKYYLKNKDQAKTLFTQILSTFKFTDSSDVFQLIEKQYPTSINWSTKKEDASFTYNQYDKDYNLTQKTLRAEQISGTGFLDPLTQCFDSCESAILEENGWLRDDNISADGPGSGIRGYKKVDNRKTRVIQIEYTNSSMEKANTPAVTCPCEFTYKILLSDPF